MAGRQITWRYLLVISSAGLLLCLASPRAALAQEPYAGDSDQDGIPDSEDNCPYVFNPIQLEQGEGDGLGNACDPDDDGDGVDDDADNCPSIPNPDQEDVDGDRAGDVCDNAPLIGPYTVIPIAVVAVVLILLFTSSLLIRTLISKAQSVKRRRKVPE